ncbi:hypothetical protein PoB_000700800 [Plakobranchus ocellatus]|uniref:Uncharacterized protein n=1 Tax=Plakobranchus ocellatus TaxID=259542 RepID=A0AAV3YDH5_9GAST|nr:hypothetical protein PoB_000700800 [Plakobranchus ocellatus]
MSSRQGVNKPRMEGHRPENSRDGESNGIRICGSNLPPRDLNPAAQVTSEKVPWNEVGHRAARTEGRKKQIQTSGSANELSGEELQSAAREREMINLTTCNYHGGVARAGDRPDNGILRND